MTTISHSTDYPTIGELKSVGITICGLPFPVCMEILANDPWHDGKPDFTGFAIELVYEFPNINVIKHIITPDTKLSDDMYPVVGSALRVLEDDTIMTNEIMSALSFSVVCNKGPLVALKAYHEKHGHLPSFVWERTFLWHFFCLMHKCEIQEDPICAAISEVTGLQLSTDLFSKELPNTHVYRVGYCQIFHNPTPEQKVWFDLYRSRFEVYTTLLALY